MSIQSVVIHTPADNPLIPDLAPFIAVAQTVATVTLSTPQSPVGRPIPATSFGSPMGPPLTSPEKKRKFGKIISPDKAHDPRRYDNSRGLNSEMRHNLRNLTGKKSHTFEVGSPLRAPHPTQINPDDRGRIEIKGRRYVVHPKHSKEAERVKMFPTRGRNTITMSGQRAANIIIAYRNSGTPDSFESYLTELCTAIAPAGQDLATTGINLKA